MLAADTPVVVDGHAYVLGKDKRLLFSLNSYLQAIDATTGKSILTFGESDNLAGASFVLMSLEAAARAFGQEGRAFQLQAHAEATVSDALSGTEPPLEMSMIDTSQFCTALPAEPVTRRLNSFGP